MNMRIICTFAAVTIGLFISIVSASAEVEEGAQTWEFRFDPPAIVDEYGQTRQPWRAERKAVVCFVPRGTSLLGKMSWSGGIGPNDGPLHISKDIEGSITRDTMRFAVKHEKSISQFTREPIWSSPEPWPARGQNKTQFFQQKYKEYLKAADTARGIDKVLHSDTRKYDLVVTAKIQGNKMTGTIDQSELEMIGFHVKPAARFIMTKTADHPPDASCLPSDQSRLDSDSYGARLLAVSLNNAANCSANLGQMQNARELYAEALKALTPYAGNATLKKMIVENSTRISHREACWISETGGGVVYPFAN
jgi:hypothetical protein